MAEIFLTSKGGEEGGEEEIKGPERGDFRFQEVYFQQPDLDTIGVFFLHRLARLCAPDVPLRLSRGDVNEDILNNRRILCIEVGGSGQVEKGNFDHHGKGAPQESATLQAFKNLPELQKNPLLESLVNYINELDTLGPSEMVAKRGKPPFPTLSDIIAGVRLKHSQDFVEAMKKGVEVLEKIIETRQDPYGTISGFEEYAEIKRENDRKVEEVKEKIQWARTNEGLIVGAVESTFPGSLGAIYEAGKEKFGKGEVIIGVVLNPAFGPEKMRKFTIGLSLSPEEAKEEGINLTEAAGKLNEKEPGWGGPPTGTIIGSPRQGTNLSLEEVTKIVKENLKSEK